MKALTPDAAGRELARVLDLIDRAREEAAEVAKEHKGRIAKLVNRAGELRAIAAGRAGSQVELDTEVAEVLGEAAEVRDRKGRAP